MLWLVGEYASTPDASPPLLVKLIGDVIYLDASATWLFYFILSGHRLSLMEHEH